MKIFFSQPEFDAQLLRALSYTHSGGADIGECLTTAARIKDPDFGSWYDEWCRTADRIYNAGEVSLQAGHAVSAKDSFLRASNYYRAAMFFLYGEPVDPRLIEAYDRHVESFSKAMKQSPNVAEEIKIPFGQGYLPGYFYKSPNSKGQTIITGPGYDGTHQESYFAVAHGALKRGFNVLCFDGPGQGEVLIRQKIYMRHDWETVIAPVVDYLIKRDDVDPKQISLLGESWGGMLAPRAAAFEHRLAALIVNPGQFDAMEPLKRFFPQVEELLEHDEKNVLDSVLLQLFNDKMMAEKFRAKMWVHGVDDAVSLFKAWKEYRLVNIAKDIKCPTLVCDSENEPLSTGQAKELFDALQCPKEYFLFKNSEGAGEHCAAGALSLCEQKIFDWLEDSLKKEAVATY